MNKCGTCKFWGSYIKWKGRPVPDQTGEWRQCGRIFFDDDGEISEYADDKEGSLVRKELVVVQDGSGWFGCLKCREDFGCILHEERPGEA